MGSTRVEFRLNDGDLAIVESIAKQMGMSTGRAARHLTLAGARVTAGLDKPPVDLITAFHHDLEEFRASLETINDATSSGIEGLTRDVVAIDKLLVALLRGILQLVAMGRMFGETQDKLLVEAAIKSAEQSMKVMLQERRGTTGTRTLPEAHA